MFRIILILFSTIFIGCSQKTEQPKTTITNANDSSGNKADLTLAMLPTTDCIPFFVAQRNGIYDSLGLNVHLVLYPSQLNAEKSVLDKKSDGCASDIFRTILLQNQGKGIKLLFATEREWDLIANKALRANKISQISSRMIGMTRHSVLDYLCDYFNTQMSTAKGPMLRPQINSVFIRENMLTANQIDAAILPQPIALTATKKGHTKLFTTDLKYKGFSGISISSDVEYNPKKAEKVKLLQQGYDLAVKKLQQSETLRISKVLAKSFRIDSITSSIKTKQSFATIKNFKQDKINTAFKWLNGRKLLKQSYTTDTLLYNK